MRAKRTDANQTEIVEGLRKHGYKVFITSMVGAGFPDIVCGAHGYNFFFEIKDGSKPPSHRKLTPPEREFHNTWQGQIAIITCLEDALDYLERL